MITLAFGAICLTIGAAAGWLATLNNLEKALASRDFIESLAAEIRSKLDD